MWTSTMMVGSPCNAAPLIVVQPIKNWTVTWKKVKPTFCPLNKVILVSFHIVKLNNCTLSKNKFIWNFFSFFLWSTAGFFFQFCDVAKNWMSSTRRFSQFWLLTKCRKFYEFFVFWLFSGTCCRNLAIFCFVFFKSGELGPFFSQKILCVYLAAAHSFNWHMP